MELIKQPNGKYCSLDWMGVITFNNYTEQDVINMYIEQAKKDIDNAKHFGEIIARNEYGDSKGMKMINDSQLEEMGFDKPYKELVKFVPRKPTHQEYASCDFVTYGDCPNCGKTVVDGMGHKDEKCRYCGQLLKW